jgi:ABC-2 type transport system ATP-binding protein
MWAEIGRLAADESLAVLLTTHYLDEADRLASRLAIVDGGRIVAQGTPEELKGELRGDAVHLELRQPPDEPQARQAMERVTGLREVVLDGRRLSARADDGAAAVPAALAALESAGISVATVTVARPSLDDVYLRHAGRRFAA